MTQAVSGLGGVGKTSVAIRYAQVYAEHYGHVLWLDASSSSVLDGAFREFVRDVLKRNPEDMKPDAICAAVRNWFAADANLKGGKPTLLVYDNVDDPPKQVRPFVPEQGQTRCLFTSRLKDLRPLHEEAVLELDVMTPEDARDYFVKPAKLNLTDAAAVTEAAALAEELGYLPLALEQAAYYIGGTTKCSFAEYRQMYKTRRLELLEKGRLFSDKYKDTVATTWNISFERIEGTPAAEILRYCAFLAPDNIPAEIFLKNAAVFGEPLASALTPQYDPIQNFKELCAPAVGLSLLRYTHGDTLPTTEEPVPVQAYPLLGLHRLVQEVLREQLLTGCDKETYAGYRERICAALAMASPGVALQHWRNHQRLQQHWNACIEQSRQKSNVPFVYCFETKELAYLMRQAGEFALQRALYAEAELFYQESLTIFLKIVGWEHIVTSVIINQLAHVYSALERHSWAERFYEKSLEIKMKVVGWEHQDTAMTLHDLGLCYVQQGKYTEAEAMFKAGLMISTKLAGREHFETATQMNALAQLYTVQGKYPEAEVLYLEALATKIKLIGSENQSTAHTMQTLAQCYLIQKKYVEAEDYFQQALTIFQRVAGAEHPDTAQTLQGLAQLYAMQGKLAEAESMATEALATLRRFLPPNHSHINILELSLEAIQQGLRRHDVEHEMPEAPPDAAP